MFITIEILILFVKTVICEMGIHIIQILSITVFLTSKPHKTIFIEENGEVNNWCYQNINPKVIFMSLNQCRIFNIFLNNKWIIFFHILRLKTSISKSHWPILIVYNITSRIMLSIIKTFLVWKEFVILLQLIWQVLI